MLLLFFLNETLQITLHDVASNPGEEPIYNRRPPQGDWNSNTLLRHFSHANWTQFCLSYLFTSERFSDGRLGVAYIASPTLGLTGGICSESRQSFRIITCIHTYIHTYTHTYIHNTCIHANSSYVHTMFIFNFRMIFW